MTNEPMNRWYRKSPKVQRYFDLNIKNSSERAIGEIPFRSAPRVRIYVGRWYYKVPTCLTLQRNMHASPVVAKRRTDVEEKEKKKRHCCSLGEVLQPVVMYWFQFSLRPCVLDRDEA